MTSDASRHGWSDRSRRTKAELWLRCLHLHPHRTSSSSVVYNTTEGIAQDAAHLGAFRRAEEGVTTDTPCTRKGSTLGPSKHRRTRSGRSPSSPCLTFWWNAFASHRCLPLRPCTCRQLCLLTGVSTGAGGAGRAATRAETFLQRGERLARVRRTPEEFDQAELQLHTHTHTYTHSVCE
jgi:hypothetical protein